MPADPEGETMADEASVFRTTYPVVVQLWRVYVEARDSQAEVIDALVRTGDLAPGYEVPVMSGDHLIGVTREGGIYSRPKDMPPGWKYEKAGYLAPKADKPGHALYERMAVANTVTDIRDVWPGMVHSCSRGMVWFAQPRAESYGDAVFAVWPFPLDDKATPATCGDSPKAIDSDVWERVPLSAYYAAKEAAHA